MPLLYFYCIVLMGWSLLPNALDLFKIYCAPLNLGLFFRLEFFNEPEISDSGPPLKVPPEGLVLRIFTS